MAYTTDRTWVTGEIVTAALMNTYIRDNIKWLSTDKPMARAYASSAVNHTSSGNYQALTLNTNRFDNASVHSTSSLTDRFTVPSGAGGKWLLGGYISFAASAAANYRYVNLGIGGVASTIAEQSTISDVALNAVITVAGLYDLVATNYMSVFGWQNSGGTIAMNSFSGGWAMWVGV